jgi:hypothetical protein
VRATMAVPLRGLQLDGATAARHMASASEVADVDGASVLLSAPRSAVPHHQPAGVEAMQAATLAGSRLANVSGQRRMRSCERGTAAVAPF